MMPTGLLLLAVIGTILFVLFSQIGRRLRDPPRREIRDTARFREQLQVAQRLRAEAASASDPQAKESLLMLAAEAEADAEKLRGLGSG